MHPSVSAPAPAEHFDVVVVGSLNLDLVVRTERHPAPGETVSGSDYQEFPGGKGLNQAVAAARAGGRVAIVGAVGTDPAGDRLRQVVRTEAIDDRWLTSVAGVATGRALITVDADGENSIIVVPGANAGATWPAADGPCATVILGQLEIPMETVAAAFAHGRSRGSTTILNPSPARPLDPDVLALCSLVVPNEHEIARLGGVSRLFDSGVETVVTTLGSDGVRVERRGDARSLPSFPVAPIDTTGAGDAFCGNLATQLATGSDLDAALTWASAAGALATTTPGAVPSLPRRERVAALLDAS